MDLMKKPEELTLTREELDARCKIMLERSRNIAEATRRATIESPEYKQLIAQFASRDPELARLVELADTSVIEPLTNLVRYISRRVEN